MAFAAQFQCAAFAFFWDIVFWSYKIFFLRAIKHKYLFFRLKKLELLPLLMHSIWNVNKSCFCTTFLKILISLLFSIYSQKGKKEKRKKGKKESFFYLVYLFFKRILFKKWSFVHWTKNYNAKIYQTFQLTKRFSRKFQWNVNFFYVFEKNMPPPSIQASKKHFILGGGMLRTIF